MSKNFCGPAYQHNEKMSEQSDHSTEESWQSAIGAGVLVALLTSLGLIAAGGWTWFKGLLESSAAPAWIQAVGSVAAIVAAASIARRQSISASELEAQKQAAAETQKLKIIMALMARAHGLSNDICRAFETAEFNDFDQVSPELMADTHHALQALPVFEIPDGLLALDVLTIGRALGVMHENWLRLRKEADSNLSSLMENIAQLDTLAHEIGEISLAAIQECKKEIAKRAK